QLGQGDTLQRGDNAGEMGDNLLHIYLGGHRSVHKLAGGGFFLTGFSCALLDNSTVKCWGSNALGQIGLGGGMGDGLPAVDLGL
ncbi:MAG: hypothetical protein N2Z22_07200, partial [Turneriella sp.]|nr:hypothetical protein [Turneriella sp.]